MGDTVIGDLTASRQDFPVVIASMPASKQERRLAFGLIALVWLAFAVMAPFAHIPLARVDAFVPVLQTVMCIVDLITAVLLFAQYSIVPKRALLAVACGYVFSGLFAFLQTLAFPGAYSPNGLIGDGVNTAAWFFVLWHASFSLSVVVYALLKGADETASVSHLSTATNIAIALACTIAATAALTWVVTAGAGSLPTTYVGTVQQTQFSHILNAFLWLLSLVAFVLLLFRRRTVLDTWLIVILLASWPNFLVAIFFTAVRFSVGWYATRFFSLVASSTLLIVLLAETTVLYARLANSIVLLRRERANRLMSLDAATGAIAHEIAQPLAATVAGGGAVLRWLKRTPPNIDEASTSARAVVEAGNRATEVVSSVRALFRKTDDRRNLIQLDDVAREVLGLLQHDLEASQVAVATEYQVNLPPVHADRVQLQQIVLNLVKNAIEAMSSLPSGSRHVRVATRLNGNSTVLLSVQDSGHGITAEDQDRIFDPFFTTKPTGMGLGLAICRTVAQEHGGNLRLVETSSHGSIFEIELPIGQQATYGAN
jgi:signal transduction histidine kinase